jgi:hypothetical protein
MFEQSMIRSKRGFSYGGVLGKYQIAGAVKSPTNKLSAASDPTANTSMIPGTGPLMPAPKPKTAEWHAPMLAPEDKQSPVPEAFREGYSVNPYKTDAQDAEKPGDDTLVAQDYETKRDFDGMAFNNKINAAADMFTGFMGRLDSAKKEKEMYQNNFTSDNLYGASTNKDRGDYVAYGQQTGLFRPDQTGQETMGRFAYGQSGGYMQSGGYFEGDEVDMTEDELAEFLANGGEVEYLES